MPNNTQMVEASATLSRMKQFSDALMLEYQAALMRYDWPTAEEARVKYVAALEAMLDQLAVLYRILERA